jgi:RNA polymerase sigma-70 factor (sigma-E family)
VAKQVRWENLHDFVDARGLALSRTAFLLTGNISDAEDLLQDTYVQMVRRWRNIDHSNPEPYVRRILYSRFVDSYRHARLRPWLRSHEEPQDEPDSASVGHDDVVVDRLTLLDALRSLAPRQRALLVMRFYEDLTEVQTAEALSISQSTVKSETRVALRRLGELAPEAVAAFSPGREVGL